MIPFVNEPDEMQSHVSLLTASVFGYAAFAVAMALHCIAMLRLDGCDDDGTLKSFQLVIVGASNHSNSNFIPLYRWYFFTTHTYIQLEVISIQTVTLYIYFNVLYARTVLSVHIGM